MVSLRGSIVGLCLGLVMMTVVAAQDSQRTIWDGVYTSTQAETGALTYSQSCASCHGADLAGGEMAPGLVGGEFQSNWNTVTLDQLFERIRTSMPMDKPKSLSSTETTTLIAFILSKTGIPPGAATLPENAGELKSITYSAARP